MEEQQGRFIVPFIALDRVFSVHREEYLRKAEEILESGIYVKGPELEAFEEAFAGYVGVKHCVGVGCGLASLRISLRLLGIGPGDEVIVQGNTFIATVMGVTENGAMPVFAEPDDFYGLDPAELEKLVTPRTKAVLVTHLYGMPCAMDKIAGFCAEHRLLLAEDCAQAHGASFQGKKVGSFGAAGCFSFYPAKNLGGFGDGGCIVTNDGDLARRAKIFRLYGSEKKYYHSVVGTNSMLDSLQAGLLRIRLKYLDDMNAEKSLLAQNYLSQITCPEIVLPQIREGALPVWHQFVVRCGARDALRAYLQKNGIETIIHYPVPPHLSEAYRDLGMGPGSLPKTERFADTVLSLPLFNGMSQKEQKYVIDVLNGFQA
jgi:dTDP-4-amino-4,6-dideoxygalactose transaminase